MSVFATAKNTTEQGSIGEARAIYEYTRLGWTVSQPINDKSKYDLLIDDGTKIMRVQVKTSTRRLRRGGYGVKINSTYSNRNRTIIKHRQNSDYDLLFVLLEDGTCWSVPVEEFLDVQNELAVGSSNRFNAYKL